MLLGGAIWYGCISVVWIALFPRSAVQARLARLYELLGEYLSLKAKLLEPIREIDLAQTRMALVIQNGKVVQALNLAKESLISRINSGNNEIWLKKSLKQYISAQDIHERTSSSHESYQVLSQAFFHSDVLYRCQRVLVLLGIQAKSYSVSILTNEAPKHKDPIQRSIDDLESSISNLEHLHDNNQSLKALRAVNDNLKTMASVFSELFIDEKQHELQKQLIDRYPTTIKEAIRQLIAHTSLNSAVFRHALRLSLSLLIGYIWMRVSEDHMGYWILLTIVFVSQQHYAATYHRLVQRTLGTVQGLALGWAITQLFPYSLMQTGCIVILGSVFLGSRQTKYILATTSITALLVLTFNQIGLRQELFPARLWDTVIGCFIAGVSAWIVLPNWQRYFWPKLAATSLVTQANYLDEIIKQYQSGKKDNLAYRFKRREAHIADAALSNAYSSMLKEPHNLKNKESERGDFLVISHTLLNYISALGAHRQEKENAHLSQDILDFASQISQELLIISNLILLKDKESHEQIQRKMSAFKSIYLSIKRNSIQQNEIEYLVQAQLCLCCNLLPELYLKIS
jgi:YccS/YhfK family integral membrane protein